MNPFIDVLMGVILAFLLLWWMGTLNYFKLAGFSVISLRFAFSLKIIVGFLLFMIYSFHYTNRMEADTFRYFDDSAILYNAFYSHPQDFLKMLTGIGVENEYFNANYFSKMNNWYRSYENGLINDNRLVIRINSVIRFFSFGSYHFHSILLNFFAFIGAFELYKFFNKISGEKWKSYLAAFLIPSFVFWSSGILKETLLVGFFGICCNRVYLLWHNRFNVTNLLLLIACFFFLFILKVYVLLAFLPVMMWWTIKKYINNRYLNVSATIVFFIVLLWLLPKIFIQIDPLHILVQKQHDFINLAEAFQAQSKIVLPILEESYLSVLRAAPMGLLNTFLRPFPWDINSFLVIFPFLENLLLFFLIIGAVFYGKKLDIKQVDFILSSLLFITVLFIIIGISTPIIGALVRYKIPGLPFLFMIFLLIIDTKKIPPLIKNQKIFKWIHLQL
jgi:hypothetical protein